jgi:hypothetical protein
MSIAALATIGVAGPLLFAGAVLLQDFLQFDYLVANGDDPRTTSPVSVNALGPYGWIQELAFAVWGASLLEMAAAAHRGIRGVSRPVVGPAFIALWGIAALLGMFPIERQPHSLSGYLHGISFITLSFGAIPMFLFMWRRLRVSPGWESFGRYSLVMGVATIPLEILSVAAQDAVPFSWFYLWVASLLIWCVLLGLRLRSANPA